MNLPNFIFNEAGTTLKNYLGKEDSVVVPNNVTTLGNRAFYGTSVGEVIIPEGVKSIGKQCFWNCYALVKIELPKMKAKPVIVNEEYEVLDDKQLSDAEQKFNYAKMAYLNIQQKLNEVVDDNETEESDDNEEEQNEEREE